MVIRKGNRMNIFESLENLNVSEECFNDVMDIVETMLKDRMTMGQLKEVAKKSLSSGKRAMFSPRWERAKTLANADKTHDDFTVGQAQGFAQHRIDKGSVVFPQAKERSVHDKRYWEPKPKPYMINGTEEDHTIASLGKPSKYKRPPRKTWPVNQTSNSAMLRNKMKHAHEKD